MSEIERRYTDAPVIEDAPCPVAIETRADGKPKIVGYASVFYVEGKPETEYEIYPGLRERVMPRAYNKALQERQNVAALFNHDPNIVLGRVKSKTLRLSKDQHGLRYEIDPPDHRGDVVELIARGDVPGSSLGFTVAKDGQKFRTETDADGNTYDVREIHSFHTIGDVSPVMYPAFSGTSVGLRSVGDANEARSAHEAWKSEQADLAAKLKSYRDRAAEVSQG